MSEQSRPRPDSFRAEDGELPELDQISSVDRDAITERILDSVIDAAEHDEPIEQNFELSHEHKEQQTMSYQPMQSVGDILQQSDKTSQPAGSITEQQAVDPNQQDVDYNQALAAFTAYSAPPTSYKWPIIFGGLCGLIIASLIIYTLLT